MNANIIKMQFFKKKKKIDLFDYRLGLPYDNLDLRSYGKICPCFTN